MAIAEYRMLTGYVHLRDMWADIFHSLSGGNIGPGDLTS